MVISHRQTETETDRDRENSDRQTETETDRQIQRQTDRQRQTMRWVIGYTWCVAKITSEIPVCNVGLAGGHVIIIG